MEVKQTRLRYILASSLDELELAVNSLPFKIEIKGNPVNTGKKWVLFFIIPDSVDKFDSIDLT